MALDLWMARLDRPLSRRETAALTVLLPSARLARLPASPAGQEVLCAYGLLALALRARLGWSALPPVALGPMGKPCFPDHPDVAFNLSHTGGAVLAGVGTADLGVDIQQLRPAPPRLLASSGAADDRAFFALWVRREALAKRAGEGFSLRENRPLRPGEGYAALDTFPGYMAGTAFSLSEPPEPVHRLDRLSDWLEDWPPV